MGIRKEEGKIPYPQTNISNSFKLTRNTGAVVLETINPLLLLAVRTTDIK